MASDSSSNPKLEADQGRQLRKQSAKGWWRIVAQALVTTLALGLIFHMVPWKDRVRLHNGSHAVVLDRTDTSLTIRPLDQAQTAPRIISVDAVEAVEAGVGSLLAITRIPWLLVYVLCVATSAVLLIARWRYLMAGHADPPPPTWCAVIWARSQVINLLPFSQVGGDFYRIERSLSFLGNTATSLGVVAAERITGLVALASVAATGMACASPPPLHPVFCLAVLGGGLGIVGVSARMLQRGHSGLPAPPGDGRLSNWTARLHGAVLPLGRLARQPSRLLCVLGLSVAVHVLSALSFAAVDRALGLTTPVWCYLVAIPALAIAQYLPIHIAGIGILEGGLWLFLSHWSDRTAAEVIAISAAARLLNLLWLGFLAIGFLCPAHHKPAVPSTTPPDPLDKTALQGADRPVPPVKAPALEGLQG